MTAPSLKQRIKDEMIAAMRAKDKVRLGTIRLILADIQRREVDEQITLDDIQVLAVLEKMKKQRQDSIAQYRDAGREESAQKEEAEIVILQEFMPKPLSEEELETLIKNAISETNAESIRDMGKVMAILKPQIQGRADMGQVSGKIKALLS